MVITWTNGLPGEFPTFALGATVGKPTRPTRPTTPTRPTDPRHIRAARRSEPPTIAPQPGSPPAKSGSTRLSAAPKRAIEWRSRYRPAASHAALMPADSERP